MKSTQSHKHVDVLLVLLDQRRNLKQLLLAVGRTKLFRLFDEQFPMRFGLRHSLVDRADECLTHRFCFTFCD